MVYPEYTFDWLSGFGKYAEAYGYAVDTNSISVKRGKTHVWFFEPDDIGRDYKTVMWEIKNNGK